ncbi:Pleiotropic drug resistance protein 1, partial [Cucurbita argyrosperma subsp. sororia]
MDLGIGSSFRSNGSFRMDAFSRSSAAEEDEEALKWAAIEKLPTFRRLRKGLVTTLEGAADEVDIMNLGLQNRKNLMEMLLKVAEEDNEKVGIEFPTIEVRFEQLNVEADVHVGSRALPTVVNFTLNMVEGLLGYLHLFSGGKQQLKILRNVSGIVKPGRMTVLLGPPSSGKTTLLLALAGKLDPRATGKVSYNGHGMKEFVPQRTAAYISQYDLHIGEMTVRETLAFAAQCQGVGSRHAFGKGQAVKSGEPEDVDKRGASASSTEMDLQANAQRRTGMILPFEQHSIAFKNITYSVDMPKEMKNQGIVEEKLVLLKGISGAFRPGVLTALMGVSGAGKTTLMDVLAGRKTGGYIEGSIKISGYPKKQETFARISGYCEQNDIHSPHVTVYESLLYSAWLRLPREVDSETRKIFIEEVMELVELKTLRDALVGLPGENGLSSEQRKRLTIAVELVANPSIIFMDEPTSGLDARAAAIVMRTVRNTVDTGRTVVCTIHQPSIDIFEAFDELFLMKPGGQEIYVGPLGRHSFHLINYYEEITGVAKIKDQYNPATWMLEVTSPAQELALGVDFTDLYKSSELYRTNMMLVEELSVPTPGSKDLYFPTKYSRSLYTQCIACLWKQHWSNWRNPSYSAVRLLFTIVIALMFGTMFWDLGSKRKRQQDLFNAMGSMYTATLFLGVQNSFNVQPVVAVERSVFYRERAAGMYSAFSYAFGTVLIELPYVLVQAVVYCLLVYSMIGFEWTVAKFLWYLVIMYFTLLYFTFYGMMAVAMTPNHHIASILSFAFFALWNLFSGFVVPKPRIPVWWIWYYWVCPVAWTLYGLVASQFGDVKDVLETGETVEEVVRVYFGFRHDFVDISASVVVGFGVLFALVFAISISIFNFQRR